MSSETLDLSKAEDVQKFLASTPFASTEVESLSGGSANYVYRLRLEKPFKGKTTLVLKHAKPYVKSNHSLAFDAARQVYEVEVLRRVHDWLPVDSVVKVPEVHFFDHQEHAFIMDDAGENSTTLKEYMQLPPLEGGPTSAIAIRIGKALGLFLGSLHAWGKENEELKMTVASNVEGKKMIAWFYYGRLVHELRTQPKLLDPPLEIAQTDLDVIEQLANDTSKAVMETTDSFLMGDFWPGNMKVVVDETGNLENIFVFDWEVTRIGVPGLEVGQICAEIHLLRRCVPQTCQETASLVLEHFMNQYTAASKPDAELARWAMIHWGVHMAILGEIWGSKELTREVVLEGIRIMVDGYQGVNGELVGPLSPK